MAEVGVDVRITYCAECGYAPQTLALAKALTDAFTRGISKIELVPWHDGSFDVDVGRRRVHSMLREGGFPEDADIIQAVREELGRQTP